MSKERIEPLSKNVHLNCFACQQAPASEVLHIEWDSLSIQLCLCPDCVQLEKEGLLSRLLYDFPAHNGIRMHVV